MKEFYKKNRIYEDEQPLFIILASMQEKGGEKQRPSSKTFSEFLTA